MTQLSTHFYLSELTQSRTAARRGIDNTPSEKIRNQLKEATQQLFQPMRDLLGKPVLVSSGYRCPALNRAIGGAKNSTHMHGYAIDFTCPAFGTPRQIVEFLHTALAKQGIKFDQIILEFPDTASSWVHIGYKSADGRQRGQILTAKRIKGKTMYLQGIV